MKHEAYIIWGSFFEHPQVLSVERELEGCFEKSAVLSDQGDALKRRYGSQILKWGLQEQASPWTHGHVFEILFVFRILIKKRIYDQLNN